MKLIDFLLEAGLVIAFVFLIVITIIKIFG